MALSAFFHKPELALRRAYELEGINQDEAALSLLHEVLSSRRHRTWSPAYEQIMIAYLDLCLRMFKSREAKDGLHQYRNLSQSQAPGSLEKVIRYLMDKAEQTCTTAKKAVDAETLERATMETGDEFGASPQAILLSTMSTDPAKSQRDSAVLLPSLKFLWETYRAVLDILRSNSKLEHVYHAAAQNALRFCRTYKRRMEFRHLCDMLRMHLGNLRQYGSIHDAEELTSKSSSKLRGWEGWTSESIELHLQTRFAQLETASLLHRYTEGFRTCEDIFNILQISQARRKVNPDVPPPKAKLMASYYEKLTTLFWVSENYLFHAFAWYKYYSLCKEYNRGMSAEMKQMQASAVLLAALCIPTIPEQSGATTHQQHGISSTMEDDIVQQKMARMATLLGFHTRNPTRQALLAEIKSKNILSQVPQYLRDLYFLLEENSDPLIMVEQAQPLLEQLKKEVGNTTTADEINDDVQDRTLGRYVGPLASVLLLKLIVNLTNAYHTVSMDFLKKLTAGLDMTFEQVEKSIVLFTQSKTLSVRVDHRAGCLRFGNTQLESDAMRSQLTVLAKQLQAVSYVIAPKGSAVSKAEQEATKAAIKAEEGRHKAVYANVRVQLPVEHSRILQRKNLIEQRKELEERMAQEKIREEQRIKAEEEAARKKEEEARIVREKRLREQEKQRKIQQEMENREKIRFLAAMNKNTEDFSEEQLAAIDTDALQREHQEKINKKKEEAERKTREAAKKLDYLVRAIRIEELPVIKQKYEDKIKTDRERYEQETIEKLKMAKVQWEADVTDKAILEEHGVFECMAEFESVVMKGREAQYDDICAQADRDAEVEAEKAKLSRARKRKDDEAKRIADEEKRRKEEEANQKLEEQNRLKEKARLEKEAKEEEHRQAEVRRMDEERHKKESAEPSAPRGSGGGGSSGGASRYVPPSKRGGDGGGGGGGGSGGRPRSGGNEYPGGGRYQGGSGGDRGGDRREDGDRRGGGGGGGGFRARDGDRGRDDRGGSGGRDGDRGGSGGRDGDRGGSGGGGGGGNTRWR